MASSPEPVPLKRAVTTVYKLIKESISHGICSNFPFLLSFIQ